VREIGKVILLVEDNKDDEILTLRALKKNGITNEVVVARDGEQALEYLFGTGGQEMKALPQLILLDLNLPRMNGLDVLRRIRENDETRLVPLVVLTSSTEDQDILQSYSLGANAYVRKPVDFEQFAETVKVLALFWLLLNEIPSRRSAT
jgi:two-component system response regulator